MKPLFLHKLKFGNCDDGRPTATLRYFKSDGKEMYMSFIIKPGDSSWINSDYRDDMHRQMGYTDE